MENSTLPSILSVSFQGTKTVYPIEIEKFDLLRKMTEIQSQFKEETPQIPINYQEFQAYESYMNRPLSLEGFNDYFIWLADYLRDQRLTQFLSFYRSQLLRGQVRLISKPLILEIIFRDQDQTYSPGQLGRLLEQENFQFNWSQLYPYFPLAENSDLSWQIPLLSVAYEIKDFHLPDQEFIWSDLSIIQEDYLDWALLQGLISVVQYLNQINQLTIGNKALCLAVRSGQIKLVKYLKETFSLTKEEALSNQNEAFSLAAVTQNFEIMNYFQVAFDFGLQEIRSFDDRALKEAIGKGQLEAVQFLIKASALIKRSHMVTIEELLLVAIERGQLEILSYLIFRFQLTKDQWIHSFHPFQLVKNQRLHRSICWTLAEISLLADQLEIVKFLIDVLGLELSDFTLSFRGSVSDLISQLIRRNHLEIIKYLIKRFNLDKEQILGSYGEPLKVASQLGRLEILKYVTQRLSLTLSDYLGLLPELVRYGQLEILDYLVQEFQVTKNHLAAHNHSLLKLAFYQRQQKIADYLIDYMGLETLPHPMIKGIIESQPNSLIYLIRKFNLDRNHLGSWMGLALEHAILKEEKWLIDYLIQDLAIRPEEIKESSVLLAAVKKNDLGLLKSLVSQFGPPRKIQGSRIQGIKLLYVAALYENQEILDYLSQEFNLRVKELSDLIWRFRIRSPDELRITIQEPGLLNEALAALNELI